MSSLMVVSGQVVHKGLNVAPLTTLNQLVATIDALPVPSFAVNRQGQVLLWNRAAESLTGLPRADILGLGDYAYGIPFYGRPRPCLVDVLLRPGTDIEGLYSSLHREKESVSGEVSVPAMNAVFMARAALIHGNDGKVIGAVECLCNITQQKRVENELRESEARYRAVVEGQTSLICRFRPDGRLTFVNRAYCRYFGRNPEELVGMCLTGFIHEDDRSTFGSHLAAIGRDKPAATVRHRVVLPWGEVRWQEWTDHAILDDAGMIVEYQSVGHDITELVQAERTLQERQCRLERLVDEKTARLAALDQDLNHQAAECSRAQEELKHFFDLSVDILGIADFKGYWKRVNPAAARLWGCSPEDVLAQPLWKFVVPEERAAFLKELKKVCEGRTVKNSKVRCRGKDGQVRWLSWTAVPVLPDQVAYVVGRDVTAQKNSEEKVQATQKRLRSLASQLSLAEARERRRIATDLHDGLGQDLILAKMLLRELDTEDAERRKGSIQELDKLLSKAVQYCRSLIFNLSPPMLYEIGLEAALESLGYHFQDRYGFQVIFHNDRRQCKSLCFGYLSDQERIQKELVNRVMKEAAKLGCKKIIWGECGHGWRAAKMYIPTKSDMPQVKVIPVVHIHDEVAAYIKAGQLKEEAAVFLYMAVRELLMNIVKHARAKHVSIFVSHKPCHIHIILEDDGCGFDPSAVNNEGFGLFNVRERLDDLGGHLEVTSVPGCGTRVVLIAPLDLGATAGSGSGRRMVVQ